MSKETYKCVISGKSIPAERVEALQALGIPQNQWTCVEHSTVKHKKGLYLGEVGTSQLLIVNKVYDDSVRSVFRRAKKEAAKNEDDQDTQEDDESYSEQEISYYISAENDTEESEKPKIIKRQDS